MNKTMRYCLIFFLSLSIVSAPVVDLKANTILERIMKRWGKKNKIKKAGKRALGMNGEVDPATYVIKNNFDIIGLEPSWLLDEEYYSDHYYNLLTTLIVGEYDINPNTGAPRSLNSFYKHLELRKRDKEAKKEVNIVERANYHNPKIRILLNLTYSGDYGSPGESSFLENKLLTDKEVSRTMIDSLNHYFLKLKDDYNIDYSRTGVYVNLEMSKNYQTRKNFIEFLTTLRLELHENQSIYVRVPANLQNNFAYPLDLIKEIDEIAECIVIDASGFEEFARESPTTVFDKNNDYSVEGTLKLYLEDDPKGERREKIAIMLPYYGLRYTKDLRTQKVSRSYVTMDNFAKVIGKTGKPRYTKDSLNLKFSIEDINYQYYYFIDDTKTLNLKYQYIRDSLGITNVAMNALGYYNGEDRIPEPWVLIADNFGKKKATLGWIVAAYLIAFIPIGFMYSCFQYWEVRNALAKYNKFFTRFVMFFIFAIFLYLTAADIIPRGTVGLIIGMIIIGMFVLYILIKKVLMRSKKYVNIVK